MPSLQVRDLPDHLYQKLKDMAAAEHRSISQQAIVMLEKGFAADDEPGQRRREILAQFRRQADRISSYQLPDPVDIIAADRQR
ncbi:MAG TPA: hypothetical protein PKV71_05190 [Calditrichia bacterium]|nr:hypothetical protein [Calditrichota bacterium]HQV31247.1 hypothetical protein [Calditrichia bacterium]